MRWLVATVAETVPETADAVTLHLDVPYWPGHRAGQHVDLRLTAEDGYSAQRSYSIASRPGADRVELTVVRFDDGEVSPYLTTVLDVGDQVELRGPIGGYFVWDPDPTDTRPVLLAGGGSGVVPLMAMLRHHAALDHQGAMRLVYSARTQADALYRAELDALGGPHRAVTITLTREPGDGWLGRRGRVDAELLTETGWPPEVEPRCYVCGPTPFVEATASALVDLGHQAVNVRTERFGPTGSPGPTGG
jgi:ferredoxin-NADP reductase